MRQRSPRLRAGFVAVLAGTAAVAGFFFNAPAVPAQTPMVVTGGEAFAYAIFFQLFPDSMSQPGDDPIGGMPVVEIQSPPDVCPKVEDAAIPEGLSTDVLVAGALSSRVQCSALRTPTSFFKAEADAASVRISQQTPLGTVPILEIEGVHTECIADGDEVSAFTTVANIEAGPEQASVGRFDAETQIPLGLFTVTIRETTFEDDDSIGVNGIHVAFAGVPAGPPAGLPVPGFDLIIGHVECARVLGQQVTTTTTQPGATTTTTRATTTLPPGVTTVPPGPTTSVAAVVVQQQAPTSIVTVSQLARTGADVRRALVWGVLAIVLGLIMTMGNGGLSETTLAGAMSYGPTAFPASKRRRRKPAGANSHTLDSAALDALIEMDGGDGPGGKKE